MKNWSKVKKIISRHRRFVITTHVNPDGDAIGGVVALLRVLKSLDKQAVAILPSPLPCIFRFLDPHGALLKYRPCMAEKIRAADALFILDASANDRMGPIHALTAGGKTPLRVVIDHHPGNSVDANLRAINTSACSTSQMIYELCKEARYPIDQRIAEALYAGIHTDTVSFNFLGTNARTHEIAADLIKRGVDPKKSWLNIYGNDSASLLRLAGTTLKGLKTAHKGRIAWITVRSRELKRYRIALFQTDGFTRYPLSIHGVGVIVLFCEEGKNSVRVSMRALDRTDVGRVARLLGGGGHITSAGVTIRLPLGKAVAMVIRTLKEAGRK